MKETERLFIQRQLQQLVKQKLPAEEIINKSFTILQDNQATRKALADYDSSQSLAKALHQSEIIQLDSTLLAAIEEQEASAGLDNLSFVKLLEAKETIAQTFNLLRARLSVGLSYALWLSFVATVVFSVINIKVLPQFREIFGSFGADLPAFTQLALDWQASPVSPEILGGVFVLLVGFLLISINRLTKSSTRREDRNHRYFRKIPFIRKVFEFTDDIEWLSKLNILSSTGISLKNAISKLSTPSASLNISNPDLIKQLTVAEDIGTLETEFDFQVNQLNLQAERLVARQSRLLVSVVMGVVVSYVVFTIFASYLPIFQLGAVV